MEIGHLWERELALGGELLVNDVFPAMNASPPSARARPVRLECRAFARAVRADEERDLPGRAVKVTPRSTFLCRYDLVNPRAMIMASRR